MIALQVINHPVIVTMAANATDKKKQDDYQELFDPEIYLAWYPSCPEDDQILWGVYNAQMKFVHTMLDSGKASIFSTTNNFSNNRYTISI